MVSTRGIKFKFSEGEKVLCYEPDISKARVLYDSKVLELNINRDNRGRKMPEYLIHFYGWSSSWDRCVKEEFILRDNEENRRLQIKLAKDAELNLKSRRKMRYSSASKDSAKTKIPDLPQHSSKDVKSEVEEDNTSESSDDESDKNIEIEIPASLKELLEEDWFNIKQKNKLLKIPCEFNIVYILESYIKDLSSQLLSRATPRKPKLEKEDVVQNPDDDIHFCKEVMDGLRIYFDFTLAHLLLYDQEKTQFYTTGNTCLPICKIKSEKLESPSQNGTLSANRSAQNLKETTSPPMSPARSSRRSQKSLTSNDEDTSSSTQQKSRERVRKRIKRMRVPGSRQGLRSSDRMKPLEIDADDSIDSNTGSGPENNLSPTRPESPMLPTSPTRLTRQAAQQAAVALATSSKCLTPQKKASSVQTPTAVSCPMQPMLTVCISNITNTISSSPVNVKLEKQYVPQNERSFRIVEDEIPPFHMVPLYLYKEVPAPPSLIYGGQHLLRLFVKLPELIYKTHLRNRKLGPLLNTIDKFLQYLVLRKEEFFVASYIDASEELPELST